MKKKAIIIIFMLILMASQFAVMISAEETTTSPETTAPAGPTEIEQDGLFGLTRDFWQEILGSSYTNSAVAETLGVLTVLLFVFIIPIALICRRGK